MLVGCMQKTFNLLGCTHMHVKICCVRYFLTFAEDYHQEIAFRTMNISIQSSRFAKGELEIILDVTGVVTEYSLVVSAF